jgi:hypothetical protein
MKRCDAADASIARLALSRALQLAWSYMLGVGVRVRVRVSAAT